MNICLWSFEEIDLHSGYFASLPLMHLSLHSALKKLHTIIKIEVLMINPYPVSHCVLKQVPPKLSVYSGESTYEVFPVFALLWNWALICLWLKLWEQKVQRNSGRQAVPVGCMTRWASLSPSNSDIELTRNLMKTLKSMHVIIDDHKAFFKFYFKNIMVGDLKGKKYGLERNIMFFSIKDIHMGQTLKSLRKFIDCCALKRRWKE